MRNGDWMPTFSGGRIWPLDPRPEEIRIEDIAHQLALITRWGGTCREPFSVAQHSVMVSLLCAVDGEGLWGLLHDAAEAYLGDLPRPLKRLPEFAAYRAADERLMRVICERFGLPPEMPACVRDADERLMVTEARDLTVLANCRTWRRRRDPLPGRIVPMGWREAEERFLARFYELT